MYLVVPGANQRSDIKPLKACSAQQPLDQQKNTTTTVTRSIKQKVRKNIGKLLSELRHCIGSRDLALGRKIHRDAVESGDDSNIYVAGSLVNMYAKCGSLDEARKVFNKVVRGRDVVMWNTLILGYAENGDGEAALELFTSMKAVCLTNSRTFVAALKACSALETQPGSEKVDVLEKVMDIHSQAVKRRFDSDVFMVSILVDVYSKCGCVEDARRVFDKSRYHNEVSWNAMVLGYAENGRPETALKMILAMDSQGWSANPRTYVAAVKACTCLAVTEPATRLVEDSVKVKSLEKGMSVHAQAEKLGFISDPFLVNSLLDFYVKCGTLADARRVFNAMTARSVVSWNILIMAYVECGASCSAVELFFELITCCKPDSVSFAAAVKACGNLADYRLGKAVHGWICWAGLETEAALATSLMDFYGRCGCMASARQVFESTESVSKDSVAWSCLMSGYGRQGDMNVVCELFRGMREEGMQPDGLVLRTVLAACSHGGLVEFGRDCLMKMEVEYGLRPSLEHYQCVIDLLGRANRIDEALELVKQMPHQANAVTWTTILSACSKWKNPSVGKIAFEALVKLDAEQESGYVLMANIHGTR